MSDLPITVSAANTPLSPRAERVITPSPFLDRDHSAEPPGLRALATMGEPLVAVALRTDGTRLDVGGANTRPVQKQRVGRCQGEPLAIAPRPEGLIGVGPSGPAPTVHNVFTHV